MANSNGAGPTPGGAQASYGLTTDATVVKNGRGVLYRISVLVAGSAAGTAYDDNTVTAPANAIASIPATVGIYEVVWPCSTGIVIVPGTGQTVSVSFE